MSAKILVVGSINMDLVVHAERHPRTGETLLGSDFVTTPGGKGANQAVAAARLGSQVNFLGRLGDDAFGEQMRAGLAEAGVNTSSVLTTPRTSSGVALITIDKRGQNTIVVAPGANWLVTPQDVRAHRALFDQADLVMLQLEIPMETNLAALELARELGVISFLNPAPARSLSREELAMVDWITPNQHEASDLSSLDNPRQAAPHLAAQVRKGVVITMGEKGLLYCARGQSVGQQPAFSVEAVDTVAAGDAFCAGLATGLGEGMELQEAIRFGQAASAIAVTRHGAQTSLPHRAEVNDFLSRNSG